MVREERCRGQGAKPAALSPGVATLGLEGAYGDRPSPGVATPGEVPQAFTTQPQKARDSDRLTLLVSVRCLEPCKGSAVGVTLGYGTAGGRSAPAGLRSGLRAGLPCAYCIVDRADVGVVESGRRLRLALETRANHRIGDGGEAPPHSRPNQKNKRNKSGLGVAQVVLEAEVHGPADPWYNLEEKVRGTTPCQHRHAAK